MIPKQNTWFCNRCRSRVANRIYLKRHLEPQAFNWLMEMGPSGQSNANRPCPQCRHSLKEVPLHPSYGEIELDFCVRCKLVWFDPNELEAIEFPNAFKKLGDVQESMFEVNIHDMETAPGKVIQGFAGLIEVENEQDTRWMIGTLAIAAILLATGMIGIRNLDENITKWGFHPQMAFDHERYRLLTSFFIHGNYAHLFSNIYIFLIFSHDVERYLSTDMFIFLLSLSIVVANGFVYFENPESYIFHIGASGGIAGIIAFFILLFPRAKVLVFKSYVLPLSDNILSWLGTVEIAIPAWLAGSIYFLIQIFSGKYLLNSDISYYSHIGGMMAGFFFFIFYKKNSAHSN